MAKPRRKCSFNMNLQMKFPFMKPGTTSSDVECQICGARLNIGNGGQTEIKKHMTALKHIRAAQARAKARPRQVKLPSSWNGANSACEGVPSITNKPFSISKLGFNHYGLVDAVFDPKIY